MDVVSQSATTWARESRASATQPSVGEKSGVAIHPFVRFNARLVWFAALPVDAALNVLWSFLFLDIPRELILSPKLKRLKVKGGWRGKVATWVCRYVLNPFDPDGHHC